MIKVHCKLLHPHSQGSVERANADIKDMLRFWIKDNNSKNLALGFKFVQL